MLSLSEADRQDVDALRRHQASLLAAEGAAREQQQQQGDAKLLQAAELKQEPAPVLAAATPSATPTFQRPRSELERMLIRNVSFSQTS